MNKKAYKPSDIVIGAIFLIWFLSSFFMLAISVDTNPKVIPIIFGQIFIVFGVLILIDMRKKGNFNFIILLLLIIGIEMFAVGMAMRFGNEAIKSEVKEWFMYFVFSTFSLGGVFWAIDNAMPKQRLKKCTTPVIATCVKTGYFPVYRYEYNGKSYEVMDKNNEAIFGVTEGTELNIYINQKHPEVFSISGSWKVSWDWKMAFNFLIICAFIAVGVCGCIYWYNIDYSVKKAIFEELF